MTKIIACPCIFKLWWMGLRVKCYQCYCLFELNEPDDPWINSDTIIGIECPNCANRMLMTSNSIFDPFNKSKISSDTFTGPHYFDFKLKTEGTF